MCDVPGGILYQVFNESVSCFRTFLSNQLINDKSFPILLQIFQRRVQRVLFMCNRTRSTILSKESNVLSYVNTTLKYCYALLRENVLDPLDCINRTKAANNSKI